MGFRNKFKSLFESGEKEDGHLKFKDLDELVHSGKKEIVLESDIRLSNSEKSQYLDGITIDVDDLVIDGNGHTIDAREKTRIFKVVGKNIAMKNITLKNGFVKENGGAIKITCNTNLTIENCKFLNNSSRAIYNDAGKLTIAKSEFSENGSAIYNNAGTSNITDSTFTKNGSAIYNIYGELTIAKSEFSKNTGARGGAIENEGKSVIITDSTFMRNASLTYEGGAICNWHECELTITGSTFTENTSSWTGGAIENRGGELTIEDSAFTKNTAKSDGGAICDWGESTIKDSIFEENTAKNGAAIENRDGDLTIKDSTFTKNAAEENGGAVNNNDGGNLKVFNSIFSNNKSSANLINNLDSLQFLIVILHPINQKISLPMKEICLI